MKYKKARARTEDAIRTDSSATGSGDDEPREGKGAFGRASGLERPRLVLFVGAGDVGRAQIAAAWFPTLASAIKAQAIVASPAAAIPISPEVVEALQEAGLDAARVRARPLTRALLEAADLVVTLAGSSGRAGAKLPGKPRRREHWSVPDAAIDGALSRARSLRDAVRARVAMLAFMEGWGRHEISREAARVTRPRPAFLDGHHHA